MKDKSRSGRAKSCGKSKSDLYTVRGKKKRVKAFENEGYRPAMIGGHYVRLYFPLDPEVNGIEAEDNHLDLRADLIKAFSQFSNLEQRVLMRVLMQGQPLDRATARMKLSREYWRLWLVNKALPALRASLRDYEGTRGVTV